MKPLLIKTTLHKRLSINQECQELRSNPSKDRDLYFREKFKTSTLGEIVSLESQTRMSSDLEIIKVKWYYFIKEQAENWVIELYFVNTEYQLTDLFTKALGRDRIEFLINKLGMRSFAPEILKQMMDEVDETMDTTIDQQVAMDEALLVYDVLRITPFFKAFLVTANVPEIYMQEFWVTATIHHHAIRFKMDNKKHIVNLESFRDMLHICLRVPVNLLLNHRLKRKFLPSFIFLDTVEHKDHKKNNEMYYPQFTKVIIHHFMSKDPSIPRRNKVNWNYVKDDHMFSTIKLVSRHPNTQRFGAAPTKPKASVRRTRSSSDTSITPPTAAVGPRLTTSQKGKQAAKASKAKSLSALSEVAMTEAQQLKLVTKRSLQQTHISQSSSSSVDEGTDEGDDEGKDGDGDDDDNGDDGEGRDGDGDDDDEEEGKDDEQEYDEEEYDEELMDEESFHPIPKTPKNSDDEGNGRGIQATLEVEDSHVTLTLVNLDGQQQSSLVSSQFVTIFETTSQMDAQTPTSRMNEAVKVVVQIQSDRLRDEAQKENDEFLKTVDENMQKIIKEQTSYAVVADLSEMELKKILIEKMEGNKETVTLKRRHDDDANKDEEPSAGPDRGSKRRREGKEHELASAPTETATRSAGSIQPWISELTKRSDSCSSFNELMDTPLDFSNFLINRLKVDTLTPELLAGPTYELMKGSCKSLVELEYHLEEVFKATTDQLDWVNPEGQQYPHNLLKPLPLIPNNRGRRVIPFDHFINNDHEYLRGGASSCKYTTSVTKTKAADYRHIKWIEDLVPRTMWIQEPIDYDKHALWGQFYRFAVNRESARDVYSKRRIIAVTELKIVEWHNYKYLDWITVRRDDDKLYKFKEGDFKRLRIQDIEDMFIVIPRLVEDLQLGIESYQKKLNLTKPDTYRSDLKRKEAYIAYSNPLRFIYQHKDKKNRLIQIDELHKFSDGTLTNVCTALDDRLKGIRMQYFPQSIWRKSDKDREASMIQAIDKRLKTKRIVRSLKSFVGGRLYEGDFRMLQRTI
nr:integrase, catalytic region, zinc finger, CCHC-type, peptidase aspartic, catalytic [Tanacetum cinerariifolium]